jgi:hypothetical protein
MPRGSVPGAVDAKIAVELCKDLSMSAVAPEERGLPSVDAAQRIR